MNNKKVLSVFSLVMINVIAVDNLRGLPVSAEYGFSLLFYFLISALFFFVPSALVSAELATGWPHRGGVYIWVREAFGESWAFLTIWLQWIYNVVWYPTILAFLAGMFAYLINPALASNKIYMLSMIVGLFWLATLGNIFGMRISSLLSSTAAVFGTIIPMMIIIFLGAYWLYKGYPSQIHFSVHAFLPNLSNYDNLSFLTGIVFALMGMEMSAVHAEEVKNPQRDYPRALFYSTLLILFSLICASLAIAVVVPYKQLTVVTGLMSAFEIFFKTYHLQALIPFIAIAMVFGSLGGVSAWIIGPTKGLLVAGQDGCIPKTFHKLNRFDAPTHLLLAQAIIVTLLSGVFLLMPSVNSSYWLLSALTAQLALIFYIFLFLAAIKLKFSKPDTPRAYQVPFGKIGMVIVAGIAILTCLTVISFGFLPPPNITIGSLAFYEGFLITGILLSCAIPFLIFKFRKAEWRGK